MQYPDCPLVRVDWKEISEEILADLRAVFGETYPFLLDASFDALEENIAAEATEDVINAFGQEISAHGMVLISVDEGNDEYCLAVVPSEEAEAFIAAATKQTKLYAGVCKQKNQEIGTSAKRIQLSQRLEVEKYIPEAAFAPSQGRVTVRFGTEPGSRYALCTHREYSKEGEELRRWYSWLDVSVWPPIASACTKSVRTWTYGSCCDMYALSFDRLEEHATGSRSRKIYSSLCLSPKPADEETWRAIPFPTGDKYVHRLFFWIADDLFLMQDAELWVLQGAASLAVEAVTPKTWKKLLSPTASQEGARSAAMHPVTTGAGVIYFVANCVLYAWKNGDLQRIAAPQRKASCRWGMPTEHGYIYIDDEYRLIELDIRSGKERFRSFQYGARWIEACPLHEGWTAFLLGGGTSDEPIAIFWHRETDEWLPLFRGALGKAEFSHIEPGAEGCHLLFTSDHALYRIHGLVEQVRRLRGINNFEVAPWSDDPEEGSLKWFVPAMEKELGLHEISGVDNVGDGQVMLVAKEGLFWVDSAYGLWNKLHAERHASRPAHVPKVSGDGTFTYKVYRMHGMENLEFYRGYPPENGEEEGPGNGSDATSPGAANAAGRAGAAHAGSGEGKTSTLSKIADVFLWPLVLVFWLAHTILIQPLQALWRMFFGKR